MNGPIAQVVALTCHANAHLRNRSGGRFFPDNSACQFCRSVSFVEVKRTGGKLEEQPVAKTPDEWFARLSSEGTTGVELHHVPSAPEGTSERMLIGFVGGDGFTIRVHKGEGKSQVWKSRWEVRDQHATNDRIWQVTYGLVQSAAFGPGAPAPPGDLAALSSRLDRALVEITAFAERLSLSSFATSFRGALGCLRRPKEPNSAYHRDLAPPGVIPEEADALLSACQLAWVFGSMGSWNDMGFEGKDGVEYERVSEQLYSALVGAITNAANASLPA